jgi:hypothetical protein
MNNYSSDMDVMCTTVFQIKKEKPNWNQVSTENISVKTLGRKYERLKLSNLPGDVNASFSLIKACSHSSFH